MCPAEGGVGAGVHAARHVVIAPKEEPRCVCCGHPVPERPLGCRWPCPNCGFLYPQGDCSD
jgi:predicted RNA-binding Zn-ribbon protein involved in translation (DUF1610 family)